jgi:hypothetical protein
VKLIHRSSRFVDLDDIHIKGVIKTVIGS